MAAWRNVATSAGGGHPCRQVSSFRLWQILAVTQHEQSSYTAHIHAVMGGGGPRWRPLNVPVATSQWRDAGRNVPGRQQRRRQHKVATGRWRRFNIGWRAGGGGVAAFALCWILNFVICIHIFCIWPFSILLTFSLLINMFLVISK
jgi:hypothetical protein